MSPKIPATIAPMTSGLNSKFVSGFGSGSGSGLAPSATETAGFSTGDGLSEGFSAGLLAEGAVDVVFGVLGAEVWFGAPILAHDLRNTFGLPALNGHSAWN